jgi:1-deoxy-D-xylulose-5-phosphate synthase
LQRGYDQLIHDVAIQDLPVMFAIDRAGLVGPDGPTHAGSFDLSYLRCIPNMVIMAPADENECRQMLSTAFSLNKPTAVRYPRGTGPGVPLQKGLSTLPVGKADILREGRGVAILAFGSMVQPALQAGERLDATVVNMRFVKPLDIELVTRLASNHVLLVTVEENVVMGGAGSAVGECLADHDLSTPIIHIGLPDHFVEHGGRGELLEQCALTAEEIVHRISNHSAKHRIPPKATAQIKTC